MEKILIVDHLNKFYGKHHVLTDITFHIDQGEIVGFVGPNGAGKSTTMKCITNLVIPDSGSITIDGHSTKKELKKALSVVSAQIEQPGLYNNLSGIDNLNYFALLRNASKDKVKEVIEFIGIGDAIKKQAGKYSMGMKQRLSLGIALLSDPKLLILDEPTNGLDPNAVFELRELLLSLKSKGISILFSSHTLSEIDKVADRTIFIEDGKLVDVPSSLIDVTSYEILLDDVYTATMLFNEIKLQYELNSAKTHITIHLRQNDDLQKIITSLNGLTINILDISKVATGVEAIYEHIFNEGK